MTAILILGVVALIVARLAGPSQRRAEISRRLSAGAPAFADQTIVTITGTIRDGGELLEAPLSGRRGVVVQAEAELPEPDPDHPNAENVVLRTRVMIPFDLDTSAGIVRVDATSAELELVPARVPGRSSERERAFVISHGRGEAIVPVARFRELVLSPGMRVAVHGKALLSVEDPGSERGYRDPAPTRMRIVAHPDYPLAIGKPRAG